MKEKHSLAKKICAVILSALMIIGTIPIAMATDSELTESAPTADSSATPDEAEETTVEPESNFSVNSGAKLVESNGVTYISGENLETLTVKTELPGSIAEELSEGNYDNLLVDMNLGSADEPINIKDYCGFEAKDGKLKVTVRLKDLFSASFQEDIYLIKISYNNDGTPVDLYSKSFTLVTKSPVISELLYDGKSTTDWVSKGVKVTFKVNSMSPVTVKYGETEIAGDGNSYSFTANENKIYKLEAVDLFGETDVKDTAEIKIDTNPPSVSEPEFYDKNGKPITGWYKDNFTVKVLLSDSKSGIDKTSVKINNESVADDKLTDVENGVELSFVADTIQDYSITFSDVVGNSGSTTVSKDKIKIDRDSTKAKDVTLKFTPAESAVEKVLNFLSFGLYSNNDINVEVLVENEGPSPISDIKLFDGKTLLTSIDEAGKTFVLNVPADEETKEFDLRVRIRDEAGNVSGFSLNKSDIKTQVGEGADELLKNKDLFEVVISKIAPSFDENGVSFEFDNKYINDNDEVYVSKDGILSISVKEEITGLSSVSAFINGNSVLDEVNLTDEKTTEYKFNIDAKGLPEGENKVKFIAVSNSGNYSVYDKTFYVDNTAPKLDGDISYSNENNQKWVNEDVYAYFSLKDDVEVKFVQYCKKDGDVAATSESKLKDAVLNDDGSYKITADEYGVYQIFVTDVLNNTTSFYTEPIKIDKEAPEIGKASYDDKWTNKSIVVSFPITDLPENADAQSKVQSVKVDDSEIGVNENGEYTFNADHSGEYKIVAYDNAGNNSESSINIENFDDTAPKLNEVSFSKAKNVKGYGLYANETVTMTAIFKNAQDKIESPIRVIEIREAGKKVEPVNIDYTTNTISYDIQTTDNIRKFTFFAADEAGNSTENKITDDGVNLKVADTEILKNEAFNDIIVTLEKPVIKYNDDNGFAVTFDNGSNLSEQEYQGEKVYSGKGKFETKITGSISPIDSYKTYFINMDENEIKFDEKTQNITNLEAFEPKETKTGVSNDYKVTAVDVVIETPEKKDLKSGKYLAAVAAENLSGNTNVLYTTIIVDNSAPTVEKFAITNWNSDGSKSANGIYSSNELNVQVVCDEGKYSAGIDKITFDNGKNEEENQLGTFTLKENGSYHLSAQVVDVFGNKSEITDIKATSVTVNGEILAISPDDFEVVINKNIENISIQNLNYDFDYVNQNIYKDVEKGLITTKLTNESSGLSKVYVFLDKIKLDSKIVELEVSNESHSKITGAEVKVDVSKFENRLQSGEHTIVIKAVDLCGKAATKSETFYIDKTAPKIESINYERIQTAADKVLNLLTFGLYSNDSIKVTVTVTDSAPSSGVTSEDIKLNSVNSKNISENEFEIISKPTPTQNGKYTKSFIFNAGEDEESSFYSDLNAVAADNFENSTDGDFRTFNNNIEDDVAFEADSDFEIVASKLPPEISVIKAEGNNAYTREHDSTLWFSDNPVVSFSVDDNVSKIHSVKVMLNDVDVTSSCTYSENGSTEYAKLPAEFTSFDNDINLLNKKISNVKIELDTKSISLNEGLNTLTINATGNNNVTTEDETLEFYVDYSVPSIVNDSVEFENDSNKKWANNNVTVRFKATDNSGSGLSGLEVYRNNEKLDDGTHKVSIDTATGNCSFVATEYGSYSVKLTDKVNYSKTYEIGNVLIDKKSPEFELVNFELADKSMNNTHNSLNYGTYSNGTLIMTVVVNNDKGGYSDCSPLSDNAVEVTNGANNVTFKGRTKETDEYVFEITPVDNSEITNKDLNLALSVSDTAGNGIVNKLSDSCVPVQVDSSLKEYEVVTTLQKPYISKINIDFSVKNDLTDDTGMIENENKPVYSGNGTFTTGIQDNLSGIDKYYTYFVNTSRVKFNEKGEITNLSELDKNLTENEKVANKTDISKTEKVTSVDVKFDSPNKDKLESGEYTAIVAAYNLSGNMSVEWTSFVVDNAPPEVESFDIKTSGENNDTVNNNGVYSAEEIKVMVNYVDGNYRAGIKEIVLYNYKDNNFEELGRNDTGEFTLTSDGQYQLYALAIDKFDNQLDSAEDIKEKTVRVNGIEYNIGDNYEIVVNQSNEVIDLTDYEYNFGYSTKSMIFKNKTADDGKISTTINNDLSGIKEIKAIVTKEGETTPVISAFAESDTSFDAFSKKTKTNVTVDVSSLDSGTYEIEITATDLGGIKKSQTETLHIDKTAPKIESIKYEKTKTAVDKVLNLLTFGLYSNDSIKVTVTVTDSAPSSGVTSDDIKLNSENSQNISEADFQIISEPTPAQNGEYTKSFILKVGEDEESSFFNDLSVTVADNFDNGQKDNNYSNYNPPVNIANEQEFDRLDFDIIATTLAPKISDIVAEGSNMYTRNYDGTLWFSENPVVSFSVDDDVSKIHSVEVKVNDEVVTEYCKYNTNTKLPEKFTTFNDNQKDEKISHLDISLDTSTIKNVMNEGKNTIKITATGNNSEIDSDEFVFYVDTESSVIERFDFEDYVTQDGDNKPKEYGVKNTDYGYFFKNQTVVTVTANDNISVDGSGVRFISLYTKNRGDDNLVPRGKVQAVNNQASFIIEANFKGQLYAYADDFVNNNADGKNQYTPDSVIAETKYQHDENSYIKFSKPSTSYKDVSGKELYSDNVNVTFEAASKYAGIKTVEYKVEADYDTGNNISSTSEVDKNGSVAGWTVLEKDENLATVIQKTITVSNNSNDIKVWVKVTDRSGYSTENDITFSIDKVDPKIEVKYDVNNPNKVNGEDFYKVDRTATVTVTERNFNAKDFTEKITNTERVSPSLAAGTNWTSYTPDAANPDSTVHIAKFTFHDDGDYTFGCSFTDLVGRKAKDYGTDKFTIDQTVPKISVTYDWTSTNSYHNKQRVATITIDEHNFYAPYVKVSQSATGPDNSTSATPPTVSSWTTSGNTSTATITFAADGKYSFTVDFKDKALNEAVQDKESEFYIDTKIDKIEIVDVEDMTAYDGTIAPVINFFDNNYDTSDYSLKRIDFGKNPETVTNITPSDSSSGGFSRIVSYSDFEKIVENDGVYTLSAEIKDKAGNTESTSVLFSVNRFGSTFTILDDVTNELVTEKFYTNNAPDIVITEINVNEITNTVIQVNRDDSAQTLTNGTDYTVKESGSKTNWHSYDYTILKKNFENEGNYVVTVSSTDHFKNVVSNRTAYKESGEGENKIDRTAPVSFVVDKTAPIVTISGIDSDQYYEEAAKAVTVTCDDANITSENLKIEFDGKVLSDYEITETDGSVEVKLQLEADGNTDDRSFKVNITDKAGNGNKDGVVEHFRLSASWLSRLLHYNLTLVIIFGAAVLVLIGLAVFFVVKKRKKNND